MSRESRLGSGLRVGTASNGSIATAVLAVEMPPSVLTVSQVTSTTTLSYVVEKKKNNTSIPEYILEYSNIVRTQILTFNTKFNDTVLQTKLLVQLCSFDSISHPS